MPWCVLRTNLGSINCFFHLLLSFYLEPPGTSHPPTVSGNKLASGVLLENEGDKVFEAQGMQAMHEPIGYMI